MADGSTGAEVIPVLAVGEFADTATGSLKDSAGTDIKCDGRIKVRLAGVAYYIPIYDTTV